MANYIDKIRKLRSTIPLQDQVQEIMSEKFEGEKLVSFKPTTIDEVKEIVKEFGVKTSTEDPIPASVLNCVIMEALPCLTKLVNKSLEEGSIEGIKLAVIDPLLKKENLDADVHKNYRPVNNLVFLSKLIERIVLRRLNEHMSQNNLFIDNEFGYKKHHSTETMMLGVVNDVLLGFDENKCTVIVFGSQRCI